MNTVKAFTVTKQQGRGVISSYMDLQLTWGKAGRMATESHPWIVSATQRFYCQLGELVRSRFGDCARCYVVIDMLHNRVNLYFDPMKAALSAKKKRVYTIYQVETSHLLNPTVSQTVKHWEYASILNNPTLCPYGGFMANPVKGGR